MSEVFGSHYLKSSLSSLSLDEEDSKFILKWIKNPKGILILIGSPGTGKTYFCSAILHEVWNKPYECRPFTCRKFIDDVKKMTIDGNFEGAVRQICSTGKIIMDDLGFCLNTDWQKDIINLFLDIRCADRANTSTIITTNLSKPEIKEIYGDRFYSRFFDFRNILIVFNGPDRRIERV